MGVVERWSGLDVPGTTALASPTRECGYFPMSGHDGSGATRQLGCLRSPVASTSMTAGVPALGLLEIGIGETGVDNDVVSGLGGGGLVDCSERRLGGTIGIVAAGHGDVRYGGHVCVPFSGSYLPTPAVRPLTSCRRPMA